MIWQPILRRVLVVFCLVGAAAAQAPSDQAASPPVSYSSVSELNNLLGQLQEASKATQADLSALRIDKWKADSSIKQGNENNVESIQRNLKEALPAMIAALQASPESLPATFKLYRNLDALYDVFGGVVESAAAFGPRDDFRSLGNDLGAFEKVRRSFADRMENLAGAKEAELIRLRTEVRNSEAASHAAPKKVIVIDDDAPEKKPAHKRSTKKTDTSKTTPKPQ
jgi:hypothetical protein